jgi:hypothetical protein
MSIVTSPQTQIQKQATQITNDGEFENFLDTKKFDQLARVAGVFSRSHIIPEQYRGQPDDCFIALHMAIRMGVEPFMFMQNTYIVHGRPGMESKLAIALVNTRGPFEGQIEYEYTGSGDSRSCRAFAKHKTTGKVCESVVSVAMAKNAGWFKNENWKTLTDLMLGYRSAMYLARLHCPEVLMGLQTVEEIRDVGEIKRVDASTLEPTGQKPPRAYHEAMALGDDAQAQKAIGGPGYCVENINGMVQVCKIVQPPTVPQPTMYAPVETEKEAPPSPSPTPSAPPPKKNSTATIISWFAQRPNGDRWTVAELEGLVGKQTAEWGPGEQAKLREVADQLANKGKAKADFIKPPESSPQPIDPPAMPEDETEVGGLQRHALGLLAALDPDIRDQILNADGFQTAEEVGACVNPEILRELVGHCEKAPKPSSKTVRGRSQTAKQGELLP